MDLTTLKIVLRTLGSRAERRVEAWIGATRYEFHNKKVLDHVLEKGDTYSLLLKYILVKGPTPRELMSWMLSLKNADLIEAARLIIYDESNGRDEEEVPSRLVPIRALMLSMLYPTLSLEDAMEELRNEGASEEDVALSYGLITTYLAR